MARRASRSDAWGTPVNVRELNTPGEDFPTWASPDGCRLYFTRRGPVIGQARKMFYADRTPQNRP
jgi:hypothetical protein